MRGLIVAVAALFLCGCGGKTYPIAAHDAFASLTSIGTPAVLEPLPGGLSPVSVRFEAVGADNSGTWYFTHDGEDLAKIVAVVSPDGDNASKVTLDYVEGAAPDENWRNAAVRTQIENKIYGLMVEVVDSKMANRPMNQELVQHVRREITMASMSAMMKDVSGSMDAHIAKQKQEEVMAEAESAANPYAAAKPTTDLSKFNSDN